MSSYHIIARDAARVHAWINKLPENQHFESKEIAQSCDIPPRKVGAILARSDAIEKVGKSTRGSGIYRKVQV